MPKKNKERHTYVFTVTIVPDGQLTPNSAMVLRDLLEDALRDSGLDNSCSITIENQQSKMVTP